METTWSPSTPGESVAGTWRKHRRKDDGSFDMRPTRPYIETDEGDVVFLPAEERLEAQMTALDPDDGDRLSVQYHGHDSLGAVYYVTATH